MLAPIALIKAVVPPMREAGWGRIVNVTSSSTKEPIPGLVLSNSHRLAAVGAFKTLATELAGRRHPAQQRRAWPDRDGPDRRAYGESRSRRSSTAPARRARGPARPVEEFADVAAFLCSERASYVCGVNLLVDGGLTKSI